MALTWYEFDRDNNKIYGLSETMAIFKWMLIAYGKKNCVFIIYIRGVLAMARKLWTIVFSLRFFKNGSVCACVCVRERERKRETDRRRQLCANIILVVVKYSMVRLLLHVSANFSCYIEWRREPSLLRQSLTCNFSVAAFNLWSNQLNMVIMHSAQRRR